MLLERTLDLFIGCSQHREDHGKQTNQDEIEKQKHPKVIKDSVEHGDEIAQVIEEPQEKESFLQLLHQDQGQAHFGADVEWVTELLQHHIRESSKDVNHV